MLKDRHWTTRQRPRKRQIKAREGYVKREYRHIVMSTSESLTSALTRRAGVRVSLQRIDSSWTLPFPILKNLCGDHEAAVVKFHKVSKRSHSSRPAWRRGQWNRLFDAIGYAVLWRIQGLLYHGGLTHLATYVLLPTGGYQYLQLGYFVLCSSVNKTIIIIIIIMKSGAPLLGFSKSVYCNWKKNLIK